MLRSADGLCGYELTGLDGSAGKVDDLYFDDSSWRIRYLVANTGGWLVGKARTSVSPRHNRGSQGGGRDPACGNYRPDPEQPGCRHRPATVAAAGERSSAALRMAFRRTHPGGRGGDRSGGEPDGARASSGDRRLRPEWEQPSKHQRGHRLPDLHSRRNPGSRRRLHRRRRQLDNPLSGHRQFGPRRIHRPAALRPLEWWSAFLFAIGGAVLIVAPFSLRGRRSVSY